MLGTWTILNTVREWRHATKTEHNPGVPLFERWRVYLSEKGEMLAEQTGSKESYDAPWEAAPLGPFPLRWKANDAAWAIDTGSGIIGGVVAGDRLLGTADHLADGRVKHEEFTGWRN